jgi:hypothetical protein
MSNDPMWELEELLNGGYHDDADSDDNIPLLDEEHCLSDQEMPTKKSDEQFATASPSNCC